MQDGNYIKLNRKMLDWEWYTNINTCRLFIHMLLKANWKDAKFQGTTVPRGSFISSVCKLAEETALTEREIRTAISHLKLTGEVTSKSTNKYTVFTVINYNFYQSNDMQNDSQEAGKRHSNDILTTTIEEKKEEKEGKKGRREEEKKEGTYVPKKKEPPVYYPNDEKLNQAFCDFADMRRKIKKPLNDRAVILIMNKLKDFAAIPFGGGMDNDLAIKILEQSIMNSWTSVYPLKTADGSRNGKSIDWSNV